MFNTVYSFINYYETSLYVSLLNQKYIVNFGISAVSLDTRILYLQTVEITNVVELRFNWSEKITLKLKSWRVG